MNETKGRKSTGKSFTLDSAQENEGLLPLEAAFWLQKASAKPLNDDFFDA